MTKTFLVHIPYRGAGPLMVDLLARQVDLAFDGMGTSSVQIKAGKLQGADAGGMPPAEFAKLVRSEITKWAKVVKDSGAQVDN